ncbi:hypothetical protein ATANTOWER_009318 [Ataeniobius toweri]|uniref:Uncharacterized protein n=1 Tax=Ataeniobius toweri TaxID=208326 RepID=A0ABU7C668_9TELE|nr:hypothetical protein [Ataeniobius toweri]
MLLNFLIGALEKTQHQQMTWLPKLLLTVETSHCSSSSLDSVPPHPSSTLWDLFPVVDLNFQINEFFLSNRPIKMLLTLSLVQDCNATAVAHGLDVVALKALTPAAVHTL